MFRFMNKSIAILSSVAYLDINELLGSFELLDFPLTGFDESSIIAFWISIACVSLSSNQLDFKELGENAKFYITHA